ncbi:hypothetical protein IRZ71_15960 [Flavobacterium sp. ANB]|uniref:hypothetical protein n=1 Tax=unclassified Flavobacterium TaxID=196869 RepID=UPI0012B8B197|nr:MULTISPECIES: hypothetical protein [unclassified Flavobacterium]MBF4517861.1 hypothetical protein [Flavobacterium sp. ANB]MTD72069.1 hypothetical protein [Flavobacterium sp. LC2016-13]
MKKIILVTLIIIAILCYFYFKDVKALEIEKKYNIVNEANEKIPATLYYRNIDVKVGDKIENVYEIVIFFDKELKMKFNPIVVVPKYKLIGLIEDGERGFVKFGNKVFQLSDDSNKFTLLNNSAFFDDPPIKKINFEEKSITFNSFEGLKKYGKTIVIKNMISNFSANRIKIRVFNFGTDREEFLNSKKLKKRDNEKSTYIYDFGHHKDTLLFLNGNCYFNSQILKKIDSKQIRYKEKTLIVSKYMFKGIRDFRSDKYLYLNNEVGLLFAENQFTGDMYEFDTDQYHIIHKSIALNKLNFKEGPFELKYAKKEYREF